MSHPFDFAQDDPSTPMTKFEILASVMLILILTAVGFWVVDPVGQARQRRDEQRLVDVKELYGAIEATSAVLGSTHGVPVSSASVGAMQVVDGSGWVLVDVSDQLEILPVDPANGESFVDVWGDSVIGEYQFISDGYYYVLRTHLEAEGNQYLYTADGNDNGWYELGTAPGLSTFFGL